LFVFDVLLLRAFVARRLLNFKYFFHAEIHFSASSVGMKIYICELFFKILLNSLNKKSSFEKTYFFESSYQAS